MLCEGRCRAHIVILTVKYSRENWLGILFAPPSPFVLAFRLGVWVPPVGQGRAQRQKLGSRLFHARPVSRPLRSSLRGSSISKRGEETTSECAEGRQSRGRRGRGLRQRNSFLPRMRRSCTLSAPSQRSNATQTNEDAVGASSGSRRVCRLPPIEQTIRIDRRLSWSKLSIADYHEIIDIQLS